jgi:hypothetical protein
MKTTLSAIVFAAALAGPAGAVTFPSLTTIYVGSGVTDGGNGPAPVGEATVVLCSNVSGVTTNIRLLLLSITGEVVKSHTFPNVAHGATIVAATHDTNGFFETVIDTGAILHGVLNVESLQSAVFCTAAIVDASAIAQGIPLHLVRVNPHPGTVE